MADFFEEFGGKAEGDFFAEFGGEAEARPVEAGEALVSSLVGSLPFSQHARALGTVLQGGSPSVPDLQFPPEAGFGEKYALARRALEQRAAEVAQQQPGLARLGTGAGIAAQFAGAGGVQALKQLPNLARNLPAALRGMLTREGIVGAGKAGATGAGMSLGYSDADIPLAEGDIGAAASEAAGDAALGAGIAAPLGGLFGAMKGGMAAAAREAAEPLSRKNAVQLVGLAGKRGWAGGPESLAQKASAVYDEVLPDGAKLMTELLRRTPEEGLAFAKQLKAGTGAELGALRTQLAANPAAARSAEEIKKVIHSNFGDLPSEVKAKALTVVDGMIDRAAKDGYVSAASVRSLLEDIGAVAKYGAPGLETALAKQASPVFTRARSVLADTERAMVNQHLPNQAAVYEEALRKYGVYSTAARGALEKFNRHINGQSPIPGLLEPEPTLVSTLTPFTSLRPTWNLTRRAAQYIAPSWFKAVRPTTAQLVEASEEATATLEQFTPILESAMASGPAAVQVTHRMLMADEDYREVWRALEVGQAEGTRQAIRERERIPFDMFRSQF